MQLKSNNNACKTPNLAVCILLTLTKWKCIWDTQNNQVNRISKIRASKSSRTSWRSLKTHEWMQEEQKHAIDTKLKMKH